MPRGRHGRVAHRMVRHRRDSNEAQIIHSGATRPANPRSPAASNKADICFTTARGVPSAAAQIGDSASVSQGRANHRA